MGSHIEIGLRRCGIHIIPENSQIRILYTKDFNGNNFNTTEAAVNALWEKREELFDLNVITEPKHFEWFEVGCFSSAVNEMHYRAANDLDLNIATLFSLAVPSKEAESLSSVPNLLDSVCHAFYEERPQPKRVEELAVTESAALPTRVRKRVSKFDTLQKFNSRIKRARIDENNPSCAELMNIMMQSQEDTRKEGCIVDEKSQLEKAKSEQFTVLLNETLGNNTPRTSDLLEETQAADNSIKSSLTATEMQRSEAMKKVMADLREHLKNDRFKPTVVVGVQHDTFVPDDEKSPTWSIFWPPSWFE